MSACKGKLQNMLSGRAFVPAWNIWCSAVRDASERHPTKSFVIKFALIGCTLILHYENYQSQANDNYNF